MADWNTNDSAPRQPPTSCCNRYEAFPLTAAGGLEIVCLLAEHIRLYLTRPHYVVDYDRLGVAETPCVIELSNTFNTEVQTRVPSDGVGLRESEITYASPETTLDAGDVSRFRRGTRTVGSVVSEVWSTQHRRLR
jgi:hypothetical protein